MARGLTAEKKKELVDALRTRFGDRVNRAHIADVAEELGIPFTQSAFIRNTTARVDRGIYLLPGSNISIPNGNGKGTETQDVMDESLKLLSEKAKEKPKKASSKKAESSDSSKGRISTVEVGGLESYIPKKDPLFVKFGDYGKIKKVVGSGIFSPFLLPGSLETERLFQCIRFVPS